ncbi:MAG: TonB-dependent receptor [Bacteroidales bacterium]|jgi:outer membrane cobalamin receptor|nr:TonB-dependent receptor [Bacteroidales bacterium]
MKRFYFSTFFIIALCDISSHAFAQSEVDTAKVYMLGEARVYGRTATKEIIPVQTLTGQALQKLSVYSVADAVRYFSGVQIKDYGGIGGLKTVNIRSMGSQHVGVFYDGIQITNAQNGTIDLGKFSLDNMESLSVYNGQKSDIFQSAKDFASASALYMVSRKPLFEAQKKNNIILKAKTGSFDLLNATALWECRISEKLSSSLNTEFLYTSGKYKFRYQKTGGYDTTEVRRNGDVASLRAEAALFGKINGGEWQVKAYFYSSKRGYPGAAVKKDYGISLLNEDRQKDRNFFVQSLFRKNISPLYNLKLQLKYANDYMNYVMPPESTLEPMDNHYQQQEVYLTASNLFTITKHWTANLAGDFQWNYLDADGTDMFNANFVEPRRYTILGAAATSLYLNKLNLQGSLLYTFVKDASARSMDVAPDKNVFTPTVVASYKPFTQTDLKLRAFYKKIFRMPTFNDLYYVQIGNRLLKPEYSAQYNLGFFYNKNFHHKTFKSISFQADAYYNEVSDKIIATPTSNQLVWTMINLGYVEIRGIDAALNPSFQFGKLFVNVRLSYTYQKAQDFTPDKDDGGGGSGDNDYTINVYGHQIPYIPWHSGSAIVNAVYRAWDFNYSFIYTGERYMLGGNIPENYIQPWYTHDLSIAKTLYIKASTLKITAEVNNVFNQQYEVVKWYPMPGTNFKITLTCII